MDLDEPLFDRWRRRSSHLSTSTRLRLERTVDKFCRYRRRSEPRCFVPDPLSFVRLRPYPLPTIIEPEQIVRYLPVRDLQGGEPPTRRVVLAWRRSFTRYEAIAALRNAIYACELPGVKRLS